MGDAAMAEAGANRFVIIGEIVKAIGLRGELKLYPLLNFHTDLLLSGYLRWADGSEPEIVKQRPAGPCTALKVRGCNDRNTAETMVGRELGFMSHDYLADDFPRPAGGLPFRWLGRTVATAAGETIGIVEEVRVAGAGYMLVLPDAQNAGQELLIPAVAPILHPEDDLSGNLIVDLPEGLFDVQRG